MGAWIPLPDKEIDIREGSDGAYWRHQERVPDPEGQGPYDTLEEAAQDGEDYANFVHGR